MMTDDITLTSDDLVVQVDPGRGSDILSIEHRESGIDVMFSTPWRSRADDLRRSHKVPSGPDSMSAWLEQYRGGWQTLCPNAGAPRVRDGAPLSYHGEASVVPWSLIEMTNTSVSLSVELVSVPLRIDRSIEVVADTVCITDTLTNLSPVTQAIDFSHHPALGGVFLDGPCTIETGASTFVNDFDSGIDDVAADSRHAWPLVTMSNGEVRDLSQVAEAGVEESAFGTLTDFDGHWASVTNARLGIQVRLEWDGAQLPYAWLWQELGGTAGWPWYRRARVVAIEPSSTVTSGPGRRATLMVGQTPVSIEMSLSVRRKEAYV